MKLPRRSFRLPESKIQPPKHRGYRTERIALVGRIDLDAKRLVGVITITVVPSQKGLRRIELDAAAMEIERVSLDGREAQFEYDNLTLSVIADEGRRGGEEEEEGLGSENKHDIVVHYSTTSTNRGIVFIGPDDRHPAKPVQVWTHSETQDARYWYPCNDQPSDRASSEMTVTVPAGFKCVSNGKLVSRETNGKEEEGGVTYHWKEEVAHSSYLNSLAIGRFEEIKEETDGVPLLYYFDQSNRKDAMRFFGGTPDMLRVYSKMLGVRYPYEQYAQVTVRDFTAGGMEHISATTMTDARFPDERSEEDYTSTYSRPDRTVLDLVAHELVHQWFGDLVTTIDWPHAWLNEGFATYYAALYVEVAKGVNEFRQDLAYKAAAHMDEDENRYRRAVVERSYVSPDDLFDTVLYEKAGWMLHQLRFILGDEAFFSGMTTFLRRFAGKNADTDDLRKVLAEVSGMNLSLEFDQFFYKPGYPEFEVEYFWDIANSTVEIVVRQVQATDDGTPIFELPCELVFYTTSGGREKVRVTLTNREEKFSFKLGERPTIVEFDPEEWLLKTVRFRKSYDLLVNQIRSSLDATSRVRAARELAEFKTAKTVEVLGTALQSDGEFWSVRAEAARSLGKIGTQAALITLLSAVETKHRKVRRAVVEGLGKFKGEDAAAAAVRKVLMGDISPNVQSEAALSLAKAEKKQQQALQDLMRAMNIPSPNSILTEACLESIGRIKDNEAKKVLDEHLPYGNPTRVRVGALKGLEERGYLDEGEVAALREILTSDREFVVKLQVVSLVSHLVDVRFIEALQRAAEEDPDKRVRRRSLEVIHQLTGTAGVANSISQLKLELEELARKNERLRAQITSGQRSG